MLGSHLRQQQATLCAPLHQQPVTPDFHVLSADRMNRRQQRYFDIQALELFGPQARETRIMQRGISGAARQVLTQHRAGLDDPDAAAEFPGAAQSHEQPARFAENSMGGIVIRRTAVKYGFANALECKFQNDFSVFVREGRHRAASSASPAY